MRDSEVERQREQLWKTEALEELALYRVGMYACMSAVVVRCVSFLFLVKNLFSACVLKFYRPSSLILESLADTGNQTYRGSRNACRSIKDRLETDRER